MEEFWMKMLKLRVGGKRGIERGILEGGLRRIGGPILRNIIPPHLGAILGVMEAEMSYQILKVKPANKTEVDYSQEGIYHAVVGKTAMCAEAIPDRERAWNEMPGFHVNCEACLQSLQPTSQVKPYIKFLLEAEQNSETRLMWGRVGNSSTIWISTVGYRHMEHSFLEASLLRLGCQYDFEHGKLQAFDSQCGRTFTYLKEVSK